MFALYCDIERFIQSIPNVPFVVLYMFILCSAIASQDKSYEG